MEESIAYAKKYVEDVLSFFGLNIDVYASHDGEVIEVSVPSTSQNAFLIGQRGDTLRSMQALVGAALRAKNMEVDRVNLDIADYKKQRYEKLAEEAVGWAKQVRDSGEEMKLRPLNPAERRIVHQAVGDISGVKTESRGAGRDRFLFIISDGTAAVADADDGSDTEETKDLEETKEAKEEA